MRRLAIEYGNNCSAAKGTGYDTFDIALWDWFSYTDPDFQLSVPTRDQWCSWNDQGYDNPAYNAMYKQEGISAGAARKTLVAKMDKLISDQFIYTFLVNEEAISASLPKLGRVPPRAERLQLRLHDGALPEVSDSAERGAERKRNEWRDEPTMW